MPFPTTRVIHPRWSSHHQPVADGGMTAVVAISVPGTGPGTFDDATGYTTPPTRVTIYTGAARIQADFRPSDAELGEQDTSVQRYLVAVHAGVNDIPYGAQVRVTAAPNDGQLVGRRFFVQSVTFASERFERDLICTETASPGIVT